MSVYQKQNITKFIVPLATIKNDCESQCSVWYKAKEIFLVIERQTLAFKIFYNLVIKSLDIIGEYDSLDNIF